MKPDTLGPVEENRPMETMSETSEATTTTAASEYQGFDFNDDILEVARLLRVTNIEDLKRERFRVDRRKLEQMLIGEDETLERADVFFEKIMDQTNTMISWPARLKIGAKSKKDPHIKVIGRDEDIHTAKEKIMQILDTRQGLRITMKLDVSYTDHSHIIGKGGLTIKRVMEETGCHIHFPDSNRSNHQEKSNQVSIAGDMEGVEKARARIRNLTPLIFSFELPIMGSMQTVPDSTSPCIVKIQEQYNVQVMFRTRPKLHATLVVVKGCEWEVHQVKEATTSLINYMCKNLANQIPVQMSMEISPQHHSVVLGKQNGNLKLIMQRTSTQIMFPDAGDPNIPSLKKSNVIITGSIDNVYLARQQLIGSLPLVVMFDFPEDATPTFDTETISQLMQTLDVFISVRHKPKQSALSVIIKGVEKNASRIYEARRQILNLKEPRLHATIPDTYHIPNATNVFLGNTAGTVSANMRARLDSSAGMSSLNSQSTSPYSVSPLSLSPTSMGSLSMSSHWGGSASSIYSGMLNSSYGINHPNVQLLAATRHAMHSNLLNPPQPNVHRHGQGLLGDYFSYSSASSTLSSPSASPRNVSPSPIGLSDTSSMDISGVLSDFGLSDLPSDRASSRQYSGYDYDQKKIMAFKAMQNLPKPNEYRVPTSTWSGYGLSQTMPPATVTSLDSTVHSKPIEPSDLWDDPKTPLAYAPPMDFKVDSAQDKGMLGMTSSYVDHTPGSRLEKVIAGQHTDIASMLTSVGLEKYIRLLMSHEVDMTTFRSLTEKDLYEIGITAWGARRKILLLIAELNKRSMPFSGSVAPGAERKSSLTSTSSTGISSTTTVEGKW
ncbi:protein bicaudal C isoform X1 [Microplitis demolitor]|uniref:protein bicaudal C isoform X1 n=1 Tax=Microplitis demolitor TaxID=69319 RepID=UPI0004CCF1D6|nr:protein bicaudal C isoform X1 [Microplitis demolitor]XP_008547287.1 protein bicaudal C isoform X1 [Microplitis demolitor]